MARSSKLPKKARDRISSLFTYLQELHRVRTPPALRIDRYGWSLRLAALPASTKIQFGAACAEAPAGIGPRAAQGDFILRVARPEEVPCPEPPESIRDLLKPGWDRVGAMPKLRAPKRGASDSAASGEFEKRQFEFEVWLAGREVWEREHGPTQAALGLFLELFDLWTRFEREAEKYQLYLGDGVLVATDDDNEVRHPLLLQRLELGFNPTIPAFTLRESEDTPEIYAPLLRHLTVDGRSLLQLQKQFAAELYSPIGGKRTEEFLKALVHGLWPDGAFVGDGEPDNHARPYLFRDPVLYLGHRNQDFAGEIDRYLETLPKSTELPEALLRVVGIDDGTRQADRPIPDLLLTQPANPEQERVLHRLGETGAVLVQGPPGTGKSHTIANLIGHLLAEGKTILVTSHTAKALRVVRDKVAEPLRSLCVSVLDRDEDSARQLEESITGILNYLASTSHGRLTAAIADAAAEREVLRRERDDARAKLLAALACEYGEIELDDDHVAPADVAREIVAARGEHDWLPGPLAPGVSRPPLSEDEVEELYRLVARVSEDDEAAVNATMPQLDDLPSPDELAANTSERTKLALQDVERGGQYWTTPDQTAEQLAELRELCEAAAETLGDPRPFMTACMSAGTQGKEAQESWRALIQVIVECGRSIPPRQQLILQHGPTINSDLPLADAIKTAGEILEHLTAGKKLGGMVMMRRPQWKAFLQVCQVDSGRPETAEHVRAILDLLETWQLRQLLSRRWDRQMASLGAPPSSELGERPEEAAAEYAELLRRALGWFETHLRPLERAAREAGLDWAELLKQHPAAPGPTREIEQLRRAVGALSEMLDIRERFAVKHVLDLQRDRWLASLDVLASGNDEGAALAKTMADAIRATNREAYATAFDRALRACRMGPEVVRRRELIAKLEPVAPAWARALRERDSAHTAGSAPGAGDAQSAWAFRRWSQALGESTDADLGQLQSAVDEAADRLQQATARYVEQLAWEAQFSRTGLEEQQALAGWLALHKKIGKGTGKNAARLKEEAKTTLQACRRAVPVWIMPLSRVLESFDLATTRFDVVILDEASQCDITGLVAFALAREVAVVGDHEQVSPYAVGHKLDKIQGLIDELLAEIPNNQLYDGKTSVYDLARQSFGGTIRLLEHFRCVPDIIQFSNDLCYSGDILPLREASSAHVGPPLVEYRVEGGAAVNKVNEAEAQEVAALVAAMCATPEYEGCTIGVICMVGTEQALRIDELLRRRLTVAEYQKRRLLCGNAPQFQGDERDVILLSMVDVPKPGKRLAIRQRDDAKKVFNVAASRARDQLWVVHSLDPEADLKVGDLRQRLIAHVRNPGALRLEIAQRHERTPSSLETQLFDALERRGYRVVLHGLVGAYAVDLLVEGQGGARVAILCDGDRALSREQLDEAVGRQLTLRRLNWNLVRVRASAFFLDPEAEVGRVCDRLAALRVGPLADSMPDVEALPDPSQDLLRRVLERAGRMRRSQPSVSRLPRARTGDWA